MLNPRLLMLLSVKFEKWVMQPLAIERDVFAVAPANSRCTTMAYSKQLIICWQVLSRVAILRAIACGSDGVRHACFGVCDLFEVLAWYEISL